MTVGQSRQRVDAAPKVTGEALYPGDVHADGFLHAMVVFTDQPHARLMSLDVDAAAAVDGVVAVVTAEDIPVNEYGLTMFDQPVLIGVDQCSRSDVDSTVSRWEADQLAVVVAESVQQARAGARSLNPVWEELPVVEDLDDALEGTTLVHAYNGLPSNTYYGMKIRKGDPDAAFQEAAVVIAGTYEVPHQEHAYLQPEAAVSYIDEADRPTVEVAGQWTHEDQEQIAHALDVDPETIRVIYRAAGGAFGGREDMSVQIVMAAAAQKIHEMGIDRPIRTQWSREESIVGHHKRHRGRIQTRWAANEHGMILAVEADAYLDAGAYNYTTNKVLGNMHLMLAGPYEVPNARIDSHAVYTNTVPGGAFRGFGAPQGAFVAESQMNKLAEVLGIDPVEIRRRNALVDGSEGITQVEMPVGVTIRDVIDAAAEEAGWGSTTPTGTVQAFASLTPSDSAIRRGRGFACSFKNVGFSFGFPERCEAAIELHGNDDVDEAELYHAAAEVGQGSHTALLQMVAEAVGIDVGRVEGHFSDTSSSGDSGSVSASRMTFMAGNSILGAAEEAEKRWQEGDRPARGEFRYVPPPTEMIDPDTGAGQPNFCYGYVAEVVDLAIDIETGHISVDRVVCADDVGRAINPMLIEGQVEGAVVQAHGYSLMERLRVDGGRIANPRFSGYLIPGIGDIPGEVTSVLVESGDPLGPFGARGMAEMPFIPYAPAVAAALHDATGVWFSSFPLTPDRVVAELRANGVGKLT